MRHQNRTYVAVIILALVLSACAGTIRDRVRTSALVAGETALSLHAIEQQIVSSLTPEQQAAVGNACPAMLGAVRTYERAVLAWPSTLPAMPRDVWEAQRDAIGAILAFERVLEDTPRASKLRANLAKFRISIGGGA
jgi:hypothetical protein